MLPNPDCIEFLDKNEEVRRLGTGRLLDEMSRKMNKKAIMQDKDPLKFLIHSTHDTAIAELSQTLDVFDGKCVGLLF
jgi:acid phosphatase